MLERIHLDDQITRKSIAVQNIALVLVVFEILWLVGLMLQNVLTFLFLLLPLFHILVAHLHAML